MASISELAVILTDIIYKKVNTMKVKFKKIVAIHLSLLMISTSAFPCTGITLKSRDGGFVAARTVEWALNDAQHNKILVVPRNKNFTGQTPQGYNGKKWNGKYGFVTLTAYGNPTGLMV